MIKVAVVGLGFMGQTHFGCYQNNPLAEIVAVGDTNPTKMVSGAKVEGNIGANEALDLSGIKTTTDIESLVADPDIELLDFSLPTREHAKWTIAALKAGKHVLCEKPMAWTTQECDEVIQAQEKSGKALLIGQCLRFWPHYVKAHELIQSGELGDVLYARFFRAGGAPTWSKWLMNGSLSGGAVLDMHVHDVDTALWWFGKPDSVQTNGVIHNDLPLKVDASWKYNSGLQVQIHGGWDTNGGGFAMGFELTGTLNSLVWDSSKGDTMQLFGKEGERILEVSSDSAYQLEIDYLLECISQGKMPQRITPQTSRLSVEMAREELTQMGFEG